MRLRYIAHANFRKSEQTIFQELHDEGKLPRLAKDDVVLLISSNEKQLVFVHGFESLANTGRPIRVLASQRLRIQGSHWSPYLLQAYADQAGIQLTGMKRFEWHMRTLEATRIEKNRELAAKKQKEEATPRKRAAAA